MNTNEYLKSLLKNLEKQGSITKSAIKTNLIKYVFINRYDNRLKGELAVSFDFDIFYMEFAGFTNNRFSRGEALEVRDVEKFIHSSIHSKIQFKKNIWGKKKMFLEDITLDKKFSKWT